MDGDVDYSRYSRAQLDEVLAHIDAERFPLNYANLQRELNARPQEMAPEIPYRVPFRMFAVWPAAWVAAACGPPLLTFPGDHSLLWVAIPGYIAWSTYIGFGYRRKGDTVGFVLAAGMPFTLLVISSIFTLAFRLSHQ